MIQYKVVKAIEISMIGKSTRLVQAGVVLQQVNEYVAVDLTAGSLTEVVVFSGPSKENIYLTRAMAEGLVRAGAIEEDA